MDKKIIKLDETEIEEYEFYQYKSPISINDIDIDKIVVSEKSPFGKQDSKYLTGYKDSEKIRPLLIFHPRINVYKKIFYKTKRMYFLVKHKQFLKTHNKIRKKVSSITKKEFKLCLKNSNLI